MAKESIISVDTARMLAQIGLLAAWDGDCISAESIFAVLHAIKPQEPNISICRALILAYKENFDDAHTLLQEVLEAHPRNVHAKCMLGYVLFLMEGEGWQALFEEVIADGSDPSSIELAKEILADHRETSGTKAVLMDDRVRRIIPYA